MNIEAKKTKKQYKKWRATEALKLDIQRFLNEYSSKVEPDVKLSKKDKLKALSSIVNGYIQSNI